MVRDHVHYVVKVQRKGADSTSPCTSRLISMSQDISFRMWVVDSPKLKVLVTVSSQEENRSCRLHRKKSYDDYFDMVELLMLTILHHK